jgi:hypothetical protein
MTRRLSALLFLVAGPTLLAFSLSSGLYSQDLENGSSVDSGEAAEIRKFSERFLQGLSHAKDLNRVPGKFFVRGFKQRFLTGYDWLGWDDQVKKSLSRQQHYDYQVLLFNFVYLASMSTSAYGTSLDAENADPDEIDIRNMVPVQVRAIIENRPGLKKALTSDGEITIKHASELRPMMSALGEVVRALRRYSYRNPSIWKRNQKRLLVEGRKINEKPWKYVCYSEKCEGLSPKTILYQAEAFPFSLTLTKERGGFKIVEIWPISR